MMRIKRSPWVALLWSVCIPGFGQLYNRDYLIGLLLVLLEFAINLNANLNLVIVYSFHAELKLAAQTADYGWLLFYPCVYSYSLWQAYNKAVEINFLIGSYGETQPLTRFNGAFIGMAMGGTLGVIYAFGLGPIFGGIVGMALGILFGSLIERFLGR